MGERSGKRERGNKARVRVERANKSRIRARRHWWHGNINGWDGHMNWSIGGSTYISGLQSWHNNGREDRIFRPLLTTIGSSQYGRQWSGWVNNMDQYFAYSCPNNKAMVGMLSYHHNGYEDRRWRFMCAGFHGVGFRKGGWPGWQTNWDPTSHSAVATTQSLVSPPTITTTRKTGAGGSSVATGTTACNQLIGPKPVHNLVRSMFQALVRQVLSKQ